MKCHYEVLNISRDADDSEIKTAYRKLALKWHPDKNLDNEEYAKEQFQLVQQAYEVLSDRQERAWYDNHREQILKGSGSKSNFTDDSLDVFPYFTTSCFKGYGDDENGFYTVYCKVFEKIASEDIEYMESEDEYDHIPKFGNSESDYDTIVGPFYAYWMSYSTKKSYVWLDPYDIRETRDRRVVKLIEKENKKVRSKAKKERNEEVRNLVAFVRKRDKRVQAHAKYLEEKNLQNRKKQEDIRKQKILERKQELHEARNNEQEWSKFENMSSELKEIEKHLAAEFGEDLSDSELSNDHQSIEDEEESLNSNEDFVNNLYCVACNKVFKTVNAFDNHETSKKHRECMERLKIQMKNDENEDTEDQIENHETHNIEKQVGDENVTHNIDNQTGDENETHNIENQMGNENLKKKKKKKKQTVPIVYSEPSDNEENVVDLGLSKKQKKKNLREQQILAGRKEKLNDDETLKIYEDCEENPVKNKTNIENQQNGVKKNFKSKTTVDHNIDLTHCCSICKSNFPSKNKLFDHLKKTGHSTALPQLVKSEYKSNKKKKNK